MKISFAQALLTLAIVFSPQVLAQKEKVPAEVVVVNSAELPIPMTQAAPVIGRDVETIVVDCSVSSFDGGQDNPTCNYPVGNAFQNDVKLLWIQARALSDHEYDCEGAIGIAYIPGPDVFGNIYELLSVYAPGKQFSDSEGQFGDVGSESIVFPVPLQVLAANSTLEFSFLSRDQPRPTEWECKFRFNIALENL
jgi:hypothetical protein